MSPPPTDSRASAPGALARVVLVGAAALLAWQVQRTFAVELGALATRGFDVRGLALAAGEGQRLTRSGPAGEAAALVQRWVPRRGTVAVALPTRAPRFVGELAHLVHPRVLELRLATPDSAPTVGAWLLVPADHPPLGAAFGVAAATSERWRLHPPAPGGRR